MNRLPRNLLVGLAVVLGCLYAAWTTLTVRFQQDRRRDWSRATTNCTQRPRICGHRVVGDEAKTLGFVPTQAMAKLFEAGVQCFDGDVIRLADGTLYMAHPEMFRPYAAHITQRTLEGQTTEAVLLLAQTFTEADMAKAEPHTPEGIVRPVKLQAVLEQYASLLSQHGISLEVAADSSDGKPPASPWLFLEPKRDTYSNAPLADLWGMVERLQLQERVAIWAMDAAHHAVLMEASGGRARVIWGVMDQDFSDQISTVPFPAPWPPTLKAEKRLDLFGIAKRASARWTTGVVQPAMVAVWLLDDAEELHAACMGAADLVITNYPLKLLAADI